MPSRIRLKIRQILRNLQLCIRRQYFIIIHQVPHQFQFIARRLMPRLNLQCLLKLVFSTLKLASVAQNQAPYNPILAILRIQFTPLPYSFQSIKQLTVFKLSECPMSMRIMPMFIVLLSFLTNEHCVPIKLEHIE